MILIAQHCHFDFGTRIGMVSKSSGFKFSAKVIYHYHNRTFVCVCVCNSSLLKECEGPNTI